MNFAQAIDQIRLSIVQIAFFAADFPPNLTGQLNPPFVRTPLGTGFFVNSDAYVITAQHVVEEGRRILVRTQAGQKAIRVGLAHPNTENMRGNFTEVDFDVVAEDHRHDLALLKLRRNPFQGEVRSGIVIGEHEVPLRFGSVTLEADRPLDGRPVGVSGYPLGTAVLVTNGGWIASSWSFDIQEVFVPGAPEWFRRLEVADVYLADVEVNPGNSGRPVFSAESGCVIGVCVASRPSPIRNQHGDVVSIGDWRLSYSSGLTIVVPSKYVIELLRNDGVSWSETEVESSS